MSLPTWERGLKYSTGSEGPHEHTSLPTWERGLKLTLNVLVSNTFQSLPTWERGLKFAMNGKIYGIPDVAPYMGAWIEIQIIRDCFYDLYGRSLHGSVD